MLGMASLVTLILGIVPDLQSQEAGESAIGSNSGTRSLVEAGEVGEAGFIDVKPGLQNAWIPLSFRNSYNNPIVLVSLQTCDGVEQVIARVRNVNSRGCRINFDFPPNAQGVRKPERVAYFVIESGRHVLADGTLIDAGYRRVGGKWKKIKFKQSFPDSASVVCQIMTIVNGDEFLVPRVRKTSLEGFEMHIERAQGERGGEKLERERVGWVAISRRMTATDSSLMLSGTSKNEISSEISRIGFQDHFRRTPAFFATVASDHSRDPVIPRVASVRRDDAWLVLCEESSADEEMKHPFEDVHWLAVSEGILNTVQSDGDGDGMPDALEDSYFGGMGEVAEGDHDSDGLGNSDEIYAGLRPDNFTPSPLMATWAWPVKQATRDQWSTFSFRKRIFSDPVVITTAQTNRGESLVTSRIRQLTSVGFKYQLQECFNDDGTRVFERIGVLAVESGRHVLPSGAEFEAGKARVKDGEWKTIRFSTPFETTPIVLVQVSSNKNPTPVIARLGFVNRKVCRVMLQEEEALDGEEHGPETVSWIAITPSKGGSFETFQGELLCLKKQGDLTDVKEEFSRQRFVKGEGDDQRKLFFGSLQTCREDDAAILQIDEPHQKRVGFRVAEETSLDDETTHAAEVMGYIAVPHGLLAYAPSLYDQDADGIEDQLEARSTLSPQIDGYEADREGFWGDADQDGFLNGWEAARGLPLDSPAGVVEWEVWEKLPGTMTRKLTRKNRFINDRNKKVYYLNQLATPPGIGDNFGSRMRGTVRIPIEGEYTFYLNGDNETRLLLSTDRKPFNKRLIARVGPKGGESELDQWGAKVTHVSVPVQLAAGQRYYLEVVQKESKADDFVQVGWLRPGKSEVEVIDGRFWRPYRPIAGDSDDDSLPDSWEQSTGLDASAVKGAQKVRITEYGDPDGDGFRNLLEWQNGTDPLTPDENPYPEGESPDFAHLNDGSGNPPGGGEDPVGDSDGDGWSDEDEYFALTDAGKPGRHPDSAGIPPWEVTEIGLGEEFGSRAYEVGNRYHLAAAGRGCGIGDGTRDELGFFKQTVSGSFELTVRVVGLDFDPTTSKVGLMVRSSMDAGAANVGFVARAKGGFEFSRRYEDGSKTSAVVSTNRSYTLPDAWIRLVKTGDTISAYSSEDNRFWRLDGRVALDLPDDVEVGFVLSSGLSDGYSRAQIRFLDLRIDTDSDGLFDDEEIDTYGTDPELPDSDFDGISDGEEVRDYLSDPSTGGFTWQRVSQAIGADGDVVQGRWEVDGSGIFNRSVRGGVGFDLTTSTDGIHQVAFEVSKLWDTEVSQTQAMEFRIFVDGEYVGLKRVTAKPGMDPPEQIMLSPYLAAGSHRVELFFDNVYRGCSIRIEHVSLKQISGGGQSASDWAAEVVSQKAGVENGVFTSLVSPAFVEGRGRYLSMMNIGTGAGVVISPELGDGERWYANIPLSGEVETSVGFSFQNGGKIESHLFEWVATNVFEHDKIHLRPGDSLLVTGIPDGAIIDPASSVRLTGHGGEPVVVAPNEPEAIRFDEPGTFVVRARYRQVPGADPIIDTVRVVVVDVSVPDVNPAVLQGRTRDWGWEGLPRGVYVDPSTVRFGAERVSDTLRYFELGRGESYENQRLVARLEAGGPVIATVPIEGFWVRAAVRQSLPIWPVEEGLYKVDDEIFIGGQMPSDGAVDIKVIKGGVTLDDGLMKRSVLRDHFDEDGSYRFNLFHPESSQGSACHRITVSQGGQELGMR
ncbi:MAG: PA14 domain-containing protein [Verrucomicrobiota bacterium]